MKNKIMDSRLRGNDTEVVRGLWGMPRRGARA